MYHFSSRHVMLVSDFLYYTANILTCSVFCCVQFTLHSAHTCTALVTFNYYTKCCAVRECGSSGEDVSVNAVIIPRNWGVNTFRGAKPRGSHCSLDFVPVYNGNICSVVVVVVTSITTRLWNIRNLVSNFLSPKHIYLLGCHSIPRAENSPPTTLNK